MKYEVFKNIAHFRRTKTFTKYFKEVWIEAKIGKFNPLAILSVAAIHAQNHFTNDIHVDL